MGGVREEAHKLIDSLPEETSWDDFIYQMYVRKKIARAIEAAEPSASSLTTKSRSSSSPNEAHLDGSLHRRPSRGA